MLLQEKQLSDFFPLSLEFCRFTGGSKLNRSPRCRRPLLNDMAKIGIIFESCNIVSRFFITVTKLGRKRHPRKSFSVLFCLSFANLNFSLYLRTMKQEILKQEVVKMLGHQLTEARDFDGLSDLLLSHTHERLSPTTLKRFWGYLKNEEVQTRRHTFDVLARFVGYRDYEDFCEHAERLNEVQSGIKAVEKIITEGMRRGQRLIITWRPDRKIMVRHMGNSQFEIVEAENTKLSVGDTFRCHLMIQHEPLYLDEVAHQGQPVMVYVAGQKDGVVVEVYD